MSLGLGVGDWGTLLSSLGLLEFAVGGRTLKSHHGQVSHGSLDCHANKKEIQGRSTAVDQVLDK